MGLQYGRNGFDFGNASFDGTQEAFVESIGTTANLVLLKWNAGPAANHAVTLAASTTAAIVATSGAFSAADVGAQISGTGIPAGDTIATVTNSTHATVATAVSVTAGTTGTIHAETAVLPGVPPTATNANYRSCTAPCMTTIAFGNSANDTNSSSVLCFFRHQRRHDLCRRRYRLLCTNSPAYSTERLAR